MNLRSTIKLLLLHLGSLINRNHRSKYVYYHDVIGDESYSDMDTPLEKFRQHLAVIRAEGYEIVPRITKDEGQVAILFDDGRRGIWDVREFFYENGLQPTIFLAVNLIGQPGFLTKDEILELQAHGFIFEGHAWSHEALTTFNDDDLKRELGESKTYLSQLLGKEVTEICLPIGYFSTHLLEELEKYDYKTIYSSIPGSWNQLVHGRMQPRHCLQFSSEKEVKYILRGGNDGLKKRYEKLHYFG